MIVYLRNPPGGALATVAEKQQEMGQEWEQKMGMGHGNVFILLYPS